MPPMPPNRSRFLFGKRANPAGKRSFVQVSFSARAALAANDQRSRTATRARTIGRASTWRRAVRSGAAASNTCGPFFAVDRPAFVIPPAARNLQKPRRKTFHAKTNTRHECLRIGILRLDVRFDPMQHQVFECIGQHEIKGLSHISLTGKARTNPVT